MSMVDCVVYTCVVVCACGSIPDTRRHRLLCAVWEKRGGKEEGSEDRDEGRRKEKQQKKINKK